MTQSSAADLGQSSFSDLGLSAPILDALRAEVYTTPTPIQGQAIPHVLAGKDLLGIAQTGTGKTAAFALPLLHRLAAEPKKVLPRNARVLVLSPTRELASQIEASFRAYGKNLRVSSAVVFGGVGFSPQAKALARGVDVLVATPGRLIDHIGQGTVRFDALEALVLDEADRMLDMGFIRDIRRIVKAVPRERQNLFFSATMPGEIAELAAEMLRNPVRVAVTPAAKTVDRIRQQVIFVDAAAKRALLVKTLGDPAVSRALVFTRTKRGADRVARYLEEAGIAADAIHGNKSQGQRERALAAFKAGQARVLVATDIAARGIDVDGITHVVNYELPNIPESYVHRIGRTARAGADGAAIAFCDQEERAYLRDIEATIKMRIPVAPTPEGLAHVQRPDRGAGAPHQARGRHGGGNGHGQRSHPANGGKSHGGKPHGGKPHGGAPRGGKRRDEDRNGGPRKGARTGQGGEGRWRGRPASSYRPSADGIGQIGFLRYGRPVEGQ
ncbi:MAG: DEAD/DEAH box helicase [Alphaproteobacteria bacterium]|nr:DEAD/DEAH box helicase [Alphaproteobacteria bacterium]